MPIDTLFILAGPRAAGKSTFIEHCDTLIPYEEQPQVLQPFFTKMPPLLYLMELQSSMQQEFAALRLHVDIFTPFATLPACSETELVEQLTGDQFRSYPPTRQISMAKTVYILTLRVPRRVVLRRWIARVAQEKSDRCRTNLAHIYSDATEDRLYDRLYNAWYDFVRTLNAAGSWDIEEIDGKCILNRSWIKNP